MSRSTDLSPEDRRQRRLLQVREAVARHSARKRALRQDELPTRGFEVDSASLIAVTHAFWSLPPVGELP